MLLKFYHSALSTMALTEHFSKIHLLSVSWISQETIKLLCALQSLELFHLFSFITLCPLYCME